MRIGIGIGIVRDALTGRSLVAIVDAMGNALIDENGNMWVVA